MASRSSRKKKAEPPISCPVKHEVKAEGAPVASVSPAREAKGEFNASIVGCPMGKPLSPTPIRPKRGSDPVYYHSYLQLDQLLGAQKPLSLQIGNQMAHDEMLFIITHQAYELWFKQILHEVDSCLTIFQENPLPEKALSTVVHRLNRVPKILSLLVSQLSILETMTPMSFLDFREYLFPASGFQSIQFRLLENKLGLLRSQRINYNRQPYTSAVKAEHKEEIEEAELGPTLFTCVEKWLERTPFLKTEKFDFWVEYQACIQKMFQEDLAEIEARSDMSVAEKEARVTDISHTKNVYREFFDEKLYEELKSQGKRRLSYAATKATIMINLYREEPIFQLPFQILTLLLEIDKLLTSWRTHHALMVHRMLGMKMGTGGSSGYNYLKATVTHHKIFEDFANLSMFLVPHAAIPKLPLTIRRGIRFRSDSVDAE